jgi:hypothetical protein
MVETKELRKFKIKDALILISTGIGFGLIAYAVFLYFGMQQAYIVLGGGFLIMASMIWWRFIRCRTQ